MYDNSWCKYAGHCSAEDVEHHNCKSCANPIPLEKQKYTELNEELSQWDNMQIGWSHQVDRGLINSNWKRKWEDNNG